MASFQLLSLDYYLLTKIINKMDAKSYFRLQQTNKIMNEFIQNNKHICVHLPQFYNFRRVYFKNEERERHRSEMDVECLYGVRFAEICLLANFFSSNPEIFKKNCDYLKKYRVVCEKLDISWPDILSPEEITMLVDIVKPRIASIESTHYNKDQTGRCRALLQSKTLKEVSVSLNLENTVALVVQFLSTFSSVRIWSMMHDTEEQVELLRTILKIFRSQPFPNLRNFSLRSYLSREFSITLAKVYEDLKRDFNCLNLIYQRNRQRYYIGGAEFYVEKLTAVAELCNGSCKIRWEQNPNFNGSNIYMEL